MGDKSKWSYLWMENRSLTSLHKTFAEINDARDVSNLNVWITNISFVLISTKIQCIFKIPLIQKSSLCMWNRSFIFTWVTLQLISSSISCVKNTLVYIQFSETERLKVVKEYSIRFSPNWLVQTMFGLWLGWIRVGRVKLKTQHVLNNFSVVKKWNRLNSCFSSQFSWWKTMFSGNKFI